jgi:hypothetical protein
LVLHGRGVLLNLDGPVSVAVMVLSFLLFSAAPIYGGVRFGAAMVPVQQNGVETGATCRASSLTPHSGDSGGALVFSSFRS